MKASLIIGVLSLLIVPGTAFADACLQNGAQFSFQVPGGAVPGAGPKEKVRKDCERIIEGFKDRKKKGLVDVYKNKQCCDGISKALKSEKCIFVEDSKAYLVSPVNGFEYTQTRECISAANEKAIKKSNDAIVARLYGSETVEERFNKKSNPKKGAPH